MKWKISSILGGILTAAAPLTLHAQHPPVVTHVSPGSDPSTAVIQFVGPDGQTQRIDMTNTGQIANVQVTGPDGNMQNVDLTDGEREQLAGRIMSGMMSLPESLRNKLLSGQTDLTDSEQEQLTHQLADGVMHMSEGLKDKLFGDQKGAVEDALLNADSLNADPSALQQLGLKGKKVPIIVLDSVRVGEKDLGDFAQSLRSGKVRIRRNGVRKIPGDAPEAKRYGARPGDEVIIISTEPSGK